MNRYDFREKYSSLKKEYPDILDLEDSNIDSIQSQIEKEQLKDSTNDYIVAVIGASLTIILFPFLIVKIYTSMDFVTHFLGKNTGNIPKQIVDLFNFSLGFGGFSILSYIFLFPTFTLFGRLFPSKSQIIKVDKKQTGYLILAIIGVYIVIGFIAFLIYLNSNSLRTFITNNFKFYLFIPIALISLFLFMLLIVFIVVLPFKKIYISKFRYCSNIRVEISFILFTVLEELQKYKESNFILQNDIIKITENLYKIKSLIKNYPNYISKYSSDIIIVSDFEKASNEFEKLIIAFLENQETNLNSTKNKIIQYLNIFLQGNLAELPKSDVKPLLERKQKARLYHYLLFSLYLILPILIVIILKVTINISLDQFTQSLLRILYIIWAFVGIFSNPFILNTENKDLLKDFIKTLIGRG
jgi:hypothetical protein